MKKLNAIFYIFFLFFIGLKTNPSQAQKGITALKTQPEVIYIKNIDTIGEESANDSTGIQMAIDALPNAGGTLIIPSGQYIIGELLRISSRQNITLSLSIDAVLISQKHGHGILEISNSKKITIEGGKLSGKGDFLDKNFEGEEGGGEKLYTLNQKVNWGHHRNSELKKLGAYNGGFIGNSGIGILIFDGSEDISITNVEIEKFNYAGIQVQFLGHPVKFQKNYCKNIFIEDNVIHDIYSAGISVHGLTDSFISNNTIYNIGHPDTTGDELQVNPGYGITMRGVIKDGAHADNVTVEYNGIRNCKRVGIDAHSGTNLTIHDNTIDNAYIAGISIVGKSSERDGVTISKNIINNSGNVSGGEGIEAKTAIRNTYPNTLIENNIIKNSGYSFGIYNSGSNTIIRENYIVYYQATNNPFTSGICLLGSEDKKVLGNEVFQNTIQGDIASSIYLRNVIESNITNNTSRITNPDKVIKILNSKVKKRRNKSRN
jgi:hypothetical protein